MIHAYSELHVLHTIIAMPLCHTHSHPHHNLDIDLQLYGYCSHFLKKSDRGVEYRHSHDLLYTGTQSCYDHTSRSNRTSDACVAHFTLIYNTQDAEEAGMARSNVHEQE
jgi:hypothetical protein